MSKHVKTKWQHTRQLLHVSANLSVSKAHPKQEWDDVGQCCCWPMKSLVVFHTHLVHLTLGVEGVWGQSLDFRQDGGPDGTWHAECKWQIMEAAMANKNRIRTSKCCRKGKRKHIDHIQLVYIYIYWYLIIISLTICQTCFSSSVVRLVFELDSCLVTSNATLCEKGDMDMIG